MVLLKAGPLFVSIFGANVAKIISYVSWQFFVCFVDLNFVQCFSESVLVVWFLKSLVWKKKQIRENCSFRYFNSVGDVYFGHSFLQQRLFSQTLTLAVDRHFKLPVYFCF